MNLFENLVCFINYYAIKRIFLPTRLRAFLFVETWSYDENNNCVMQGDWTI